MKKFLIFILLLSSNVALSQIGSISGSKTLKVQDLNNALKSCAHANGYADSVELSSILTLDCSNSNFINKSVNGIGDMKNLEVLNLSNNPLLISLESFTKLQHLESLDLSTNQNMNLSTINSLTTLKILNLSQMNISNIPNLNSLTVLETLDLSENLELTNFANLPSGLTGLDIKSTNGFGQSYCAQIAATGEAHESLTISANQSNIEDCAGVNGLHYLFVNGGDFDSEIQNVSSFTNGICALIVKSTNLKQLNGQAQIFDQLSLLNNVALKKVEPFAFDVNGGLVLPMGLYITEDDSKLLCSNKFAIDAVPVYDPNPISKSAKDSPPNKTTVFCPNLAVVRAGIKETPEFCTPDELGSIEVYQDLETQKRFITWEKDPAVDYIQMGITEYEIKGYDSDGNVIMQRRIAIDTTHVYVSHFMAPVKYSISACNDNTCGYEIEDSQFSKGLSRVRNVSTIWDFTSTNPQFMFEFNYSNFYSDISPSQTVVVPEEFRIIADFPQALGSTLLASIPVSVNPVNGALTWQNPVFNYPDIIGNSFKIVACNALLGCGAATDITISLPVSSTNLPTPNWVNVSNNLGKQTQIKLEWSLPGTSDNECNSATVADLDCVDYIEINEWQPKINADSSYHQVSSIYDKYHRIYYIDKVDAPLILSRLTYSGYDFDLRSCHRDRQNGDICSAFTGGFHQLTAQDPNCTTAKTCNLGVADIVLDRLDVITTSTDFAKPINFGWYHPDGAGFQRQIVWEVPNGIKPDYFYLKSSGVNSCRIGSNKYIDELTIDYADRITVQGNQWITEVDCQYMKTGVTWTVQTCFNGVGCSQPVAIEFSGLATKSDPVDRNLPNTNSPIQVNPAQAGPGGLNPAMWWNPGLAGSGWHFFFANELGNSMESSYDLVGYWYAYREMNGVWTPTWIEAKMIQKKEVTGAVYYEGSLNYYDHSLNPVAMEAGDIKLNLGADKHHAILKIKPSIGNGLFSQPNASDLGPYTQAGDEFTLEINDIALNFNEINGSARNNDDHHSGVWQHKNANQELEVSVNTWIENGFEYTIFATFDTNGVPIWLTAVNICTDPTGSCSSHGGYFDDFDQGSIYGQNGIPTGTGNLGMVSYGFNPLAGKPLNHNFGSIDGGTTNYHGNAGRCLNLGTAQEKNKKGSFWMNLIEPLSYPAAGDNPAFTRNVNNYGTQSGQCSNPSLDKVASLHNIDFKIEGQADTDWICNPNNTGDCIIDFTWYTDDDFDSIEPYYKRGTSSYQPLSGLCDNTIPTDVFVVTDYQCTITIPGTYTFQLRKANYISPFNKDVVIAESQDLEVIECTTTNCVIDETIVNSSVETFIGPDEIVIGGNGNGNGILELSDLPTAPSSSSTVGATAGSFNVSTNGAATYSIPIMTAPASGGLAPNFSLNYSSQSSKSSMGQGWSIGGYSIINRCPQTYDQDYDAVSDDPLVLSVNFTSSDRFCVDGKRLFLESGTYGADGAVYKTEINDFTKYTSSGSQGGSPTCFKAEHKNGNVVYYGNCDIGANEEETALVDSALTLVPADNPAFAWAQSRMIDVAGNYYDIAYYSGRVTTFDASCNPAEFDESTIEFYPKKVYYSGNTVASQTTKDSIEFVYESQIECLGFYNEIDGDAISTNPTIKHLRNNRRLLRVDSKSNNEDLRSFKLNYTEHFPGGTGVDDGLSPYKVLSSIQECTDTGLAICYQPTVFNWDTGSIKSIGASTIDPNSPFLEFTNFYDDPSPTVSEDYYVRPYDANGDGQTDFALNYKTDHDTYVNKLAIADGSGGYNMITPPVNIATYGNNRRVIDINGDGFNDIATRTQIYLWNGTNYDTPITLGFNADNFFDLDGDGLPEAIEYTAVGAFPNIEYSFKVYKNIIGATHDLSNIFESEFKLMNMNIDDVQFINGGQITVDLAPFDVTEISDVFDDNGDGISEILVKVGYEVCIDEPSANFACSDGDSSLLIEQWAIARLELLDNEWFYKVETFEPTTSCSPLTLCGHGVTQPTFIDLNNDGAQEMCYVDIRTFADPSRVIKDWICYERGNNVVNSGFGYKQIFKKSFTVHVTEDIYEYFNQTSYEDYNGDGFIDLMFSDGTNGDVGNPDISKWSVIYTNSFNGEFKIEENFVYDTGIIAGRGQPSDPNVTRDGFKLDKHLFIDVNNDGLKDSLLFKYDPNDLKIKVYKTMGTITGGSINSKDKITSITQGLGKNIEIEYKPMFNASVYTRENNSVNAWYGSGKTPVYDYISQMSLVSEYSIDLPAYDIAASDLSGPSSVLPNMLQTYQYHYYGAKIQAGGRGFLGFKTFEVYDANNSILNQTDYHQEFPFTGLAYKEQKYFIEPNSSPAILRAANGENKLIPCWVNGNCEPVIPPVDPCLRVTGLICNTPQLASVPTGAKLISSVDSQWKDKSVTVGEKTSVFIYPEIVATDQYELDGSSQIGRTVVGTQYNENAANDYGNPTQIIESTYNNGSLTALLTKTTDLDYFYTTATNYVVDRLKTKTTTYSRPTTGNDQIRKTAYTYDSNNLLFTEKQTSGSNIIDFVQKKYATRDNFGNTTKVELTATSATTRITEYTFDVQGRYVVKTIAGGQLQSNVVSRDKFGNPTVVENQQGIATFYSYDDFGGLFYKIDELGQWQQTTKTMGSGSYCSGTGAAFYTTTTSIQPTTWACIDELGRNIRTITQGFAPGSVIYVDKHFDISGDLLEQSMPRFSVPLKTDASHWQRNTYDAFKRPLKTRNANGDITLYSYSPLVSEVTNALNKTTTTVSNMLGEVVSVTDADLAVTTYAYDDIGRQVSIDGPLSGTVDKLITHYDSFDNVDSIDDPDLGVWTYHYNLYGELQYQRDAKANCTVLTYDNLGRKTSKSYKKNANTDCSIGDFGGQNIFIFDNDATSPTFGLMTQENNQKMIKNYFYDGLSRLETVTTNYIGEGIAGTDLITTQDSYYDEYSRPLAQYDATEQSVRFEYNGQGYPIKTIDQFSNTVFEQVMGQDAFGNIKTVKAGNEVTTTKTFDKIGRVESIFTTHPTQVIQNLNYVYDAVGNLKSREDARDPGNVFYEEFTYDSVNRLKIVKARTGAVTLTETMSFSYDEGGRITNFNGNNYSYTGSSVHGVSSITGNTSKSFSYDANGNQENSDGRTLIYSAFNKTTHMDKGVASVDFVYGSGNNRIKRMDVGNDENETTYYIGNVELYYDNNHNFIKSKRYIGNTVITQYDATNTREVKYLHKDHLGSIQSVTNEVFSAISTEHLSYDAFGRRRDASNNSSIINYNPIYNSLADVTKKGFTGQEHIDQLGVINFNARLYDPELGIMLQADTIIPDGPVTQSLNRYSYVFNNPLSYTDPTGHKPFGVITQTEAAKQKRFFKEAQGRIKAEKEAENNKSDDAKIETPVGGNNNGTFGGNSNGLGGDSVALPNATVTPGDSGRGFFNHSSAAKEGVFNAFGFYGGLEFLSNTFNSSDLNDVGNIGDLREAYFWDLYGVNGDYWRFKSVTLSGNLSFATKGQQIGKGMGMLRFNHATKNISQINPSRIRFSQNKVNGANAIAQNMRNNGWVGSPIDVVRLSDGGLTTLDNTRVLAASMARIDVNAIIRSSSDALPTNLIQRFTTKNGVPATWGDAVNLRIGNQSAAFRNKYPNGSNITGVGN